MHTREREGGRDRQREGERERSRRGTEKNDIKRNSISSDQHKEMKPTYVVVLIIIPATSYLLAHKHTLVHIKFNHDYTRLNIPFVSLLTYVSCLQLHFLVY